MRLFVENFEPIPEENFRFPVGILARQKDEREKEHGKAIRLNHPGLSTQAKIFDQKGSKKAEI